MFTTKHSHMIKFSQSPCRTGQKLIPHFKGEKLKPQGEWTTWAIQLIRARAQIKAPITSCLVQRVFFVINHIFKEKISNNI